MQRTDWFKELDLVFGTIIYAGYAPVCIMLNKMTNKELNELELTKNRRINNFNRFNRKEH